MGWEDLRCGNAIVAYGVRLLLINADANTAQWYANNVPLVRQHRPVLRQHIPTLPSASPYYSPRPNSHALRPHPWNPAHGLARCSLVVLDCRAPLMTTANPPQVRPAGHNAAAGGRARAHRRPRPRLARPRPPPSPPPRPWPQPRLNWRREPKPRPPLIRPRPLRPHRPARSSTLGPPKPP